jgi:hypothetical protein
VSELASILTAIAALIVAVGAFYLIVRLSTVADAMVEYLKKDDD